MIRSLHQKLRGLIRQILQQNVTPGRLAAGVVIGCLVGCSPLIGLHLSICIVLAWLLGLNQVVVYGAANVSLPPFVGFIGFAAVQLGERVRHGRWLSVHAADFTWRNAGALAKTFFVDWLVGGVFVGLALGAVLATLVYVVARRRRRAAPIQAEDPIDAAIELASRRYDPAPRRFRYYARMKYRMDPCYHAIATMVPPGATVVDLGTGLGMLPVLLGVMAGGRRALGVEWDPAKAACGIEAARELPGIEIRAGDAWQVELPPCDVVTLVDVLHYHPVEAQRALLARCRAALRPGGRILVREGDPERRGGARLTRFFERLVTRLGWNRGPEVRFRPVAELKADLEALGLQVHVDDVAGRTHPGNVLLCADDRAATVEERSSP